MERVITFGIGIGRECEVEREGAKKIGGIGCVRVCVKGCVGRHRVKDMEKVGRYEWLDRKSEQ